MITKLEIDGSDYFNTLLQENRGASLQCKLHINFESEINNPVSSDFRFVLTNESNLQNIFLGTAPYGIYSEGLVKLYAGLLIFEGYLDKEEIPVDFNGKLIDMVVIGKEQYYSELLSQHDITQIYYVLDTTSVRQRGGRTGGTRFNPANYEPIEAMLTDMLKDIGFAAADIVLSFKNIFNYKYNVGKYGATYKKYAVAKTRGYYVRSEFLEVSSNKASSFAENEQKTDSYNFFLKQWAMLTGCIYFYHYNSGKFFFINRDYNFLADTGGAILNIDDLILDEKRPVKYKYAYNGIELRFDDITILLKVSRSGLMPGGTKEYGCEGDQLEVVLSPPNYLVKKDSAYLYKFGAAPNQALQVRKPISIQMNSNLSDYIDPDVGTGTKITDFLDDIYDNYESVLNAYREEELTLDGTYTAPLRILYNGNTYNVFDTEVDFNEKTTKIRFEY